MEWNLRKGFTFEKENMYMHFCRHGKYVQLSKVLLKKTFLESEIYTTSSITGNKLLSRT